MALGLALFGSLAIARPAPNAGRAAATAAYVLLLLAITYWALMISKYLKTSEVGADVIDGMQGRYILPLLPFLLLAMPGGPSRLPAVLLALPALLLAVADFGYLPIRLVVTYYVH